MVSTILSPLIWRIVLILIHHRSKQLLLRAQANEIHTNKRAEISNQLPNYWKPFQVNKGINYLYKVLLS